ILNFSIIFSSIILITISITFIAHFLPVRNINLEKASPYECGFDPLNSTRIPFSFRFFLIAILFLLFDLEIALLLPLPPSLFLFQPNITFLTLEIFLIILYIGLAFEWINGGLEWAD
uniref:NADH dehydrogenase subunit 3 n=1 Tax=Asthenactis papyraceus TaxID=2939277 RepID=UPI00202906FF